MKCPKCNNEVAENDVYCENCGTKLPHMVECPNCHEQISSDDEFCMFCGTKNAQFDGVHVEVPLRNTTNTTVSNTSITNTNPTASSFGYVAPKKKNSNLLIIIFASIGAVVIITAAILIIPKITSNLSNTIKENNQKTVEEQVQQEVVEPIQEQTVVEEPEVVENNKIRINARMKIRSIPSTSGEIMGYAEETYEYNFYDIAYGEGYTWYNVGPNQWIASNGEWVSEFH